MDSVYAAAYPDLYRNHWWWRVREQILLDTIAPLLRGVPKARILDVGCGAGLFFDALQRFGQVEGIESDRMAVQNAGKWRNVIHQGELNGSFTPMQPYHLILLLDVLEHVSQPVEVLRHAAAHLHSGGKILITVPAFNWLWTAHDDVNHHLKRYSAAAMHRAVVASGLSTDRRRYLFPSLVIPKALVRVREKLIGSSSTVPHIPSAPVNSIVQLVLRAEYALTRWVPFGTSLMVVASRRGELNGGA
jgi:SAM-dependent methyltransferase